MKKIIYLVVVLVSFINCSDAIDELQDNEIIAREKRGGFGENSTIFAVDIMVVHYVTGTTQSQIDTLRNKYFTDSFSGGSLKGILFPDFYTVELNDLTATNNILIDVWRINKMVSGKPGHGIKGQLDEEEIVYDIDPH